MAKWLLFFLSIPIMLMGLFTTGFALPILLGRSVLLIVGLYIIVCLYFYKRLLLNTDKSIWYKSGIQIVFFIICVAFYGYASVQLFYRPGNFRFDDFKTREQAQAYFDEHYPIGSDMKNLIADVTTVGGWCSGGQQTADRRGPVQKFNYDKMYGCDYYNWFFSFDPLERFAITIYADKDDRIISSYIAKHYMWG